MAGRDISTTKLGLASTRIIACCANGGQAVGTAAALCTKYGVQPRELMPHIKELQQLLIKDDSFLPGIPNEDEKDLARNATFTASSFIAGSEPMKVLDGVTRRLDGDSHGWESDGIAEGGETLTMTLPKAETLSQLRLIFDSNFNYPIRVTMSKNRQNQQRVGVPMELVKDYDILLYKNGELVRTVERRGNYLRLDVVDFEPTECDKADIRFLSTNGGDHVTVFEVRAY